MIQKRIPLIAAHLLLALFTFAVSGRAQVGTSRVTGVVTDKAGAVVAGANVTLTNEATNVSFTTATSESGVYVFDAIQVGTYTVAAEAAGFKKLVATGNVLTVGVPLTVNVELEVGVASESVEVSGVYEKVQTSASGNLGAVVDNKTLVDLPLGLEAGTGGRNPLTFLRLQPGVSVGSNTGGGTHVNGARDRAQNQTLDGIDINETSAGGSDFSPLRTNPDSLQEFRAITSNASAEFGRGSGAQVALVTKSGTNQIHGNLFYFYRGSAFAANEWQNNLNNIRKPFLLQNQYGGSVGGPVLRDRTFYFFNFQGQRQKQQRTVTRTVFTPTAKQGVFRYRVGGQNGAAGTANAVVDASGNPLFPACSATVTTNCIASYNIAALDPQRRGLDPTLQQWYARQPAPNSFAAAGDGLNTAAYLFNVPINNPQEDYTFKVDHRFNDNNTVFFRYAWGRQDTPDDIANGGDPRFPGEPGTVDTLRKPTNWAANYRRVLSNTMVNELVVGANLFTFSFFNPVVGQQPFTLVTNLTTDPIPTFGEGNARVLSTYQVVDNFSWTRGAHLVKAGINLRYQIHEDQRGSIAGQNAYPSVNFSRAITTPNSNCATGSFGTTGTTGVVGGQERFCLPGTATTSPLFINANDLTRLQSTINDVLGRVGSIGQGFVASPSGFNYQPGGTLFLNDARYPEYDWYIQDTWKVRRNLTIDYGLRWEGRLTPFARNRLFTPDQPVKIGAPPSNTLRWVDNDLYDSDLNNWSPTFGFAWDPFGDGKTAVRANYRLAYDRINTFVISSAIYNTIPGITLSAVNSTFGPGGGRLRDGIPSVVPPATARPVDLAQPAALGAASSNITVLDPDFRSPKTNMWSLNLQREIGKGMLVDVAYIGRRASGLFGAYDVNQVELNRNGFLTEYQKVVAGQESTLLNQLYQPDTRRGMRTGSEFIRQQFFGYAPSTGAYNPANFSPVVLNNVGAVALDASRQRVSGRSLAEAAGLGPFFFRRFPQFEQINVIDANDFSTYHALQVMVQRKFTRNLTFQGSYTFSKSLDTRSYDPAFTVVSRSTNQSASSTPFDVNNRRLNYARSDFDQTHYFVGYGVWDLPFGKGQRLFADAPGVVQRLIEGWNVNGVVTTSSGRPFTVYSGINQVGDINSVPANCNNCPKSMGQLRDLPAPGLNGNVKVYFSPDETARFSQPAAGTIGNTGRNYFTGPRRFNIDAALLKRTTIREGMNFEFRVEFFNVTNSVRFDFPTAVITNAAFGRIFDSVIFESRKIRFGAKLNF
jgi:hypothetical protein